MPTYDYECTKCSARYELRQGFDAPSSHRCEECGKGTAKRVLSAPRIVFKGSGWYVTDSKKSTSAVSDGTSSESESAAARDEKPAKKEKAKTPILTLFRRHWLLVLLAALTFAGNNAAGYMTTGGYLQNYATTPIEDGGLVGMERTPVLLAVAGASIVWLVMTFAAGIVSAPTVVAVTGLERVDSAAGSASGNRLGERRRHTQNPSPRMAPIATRASMSGR